jgi:hypothetical protein
MFSAQHPHGRAVRQRVGNVAVNPVGPAAFVPVPVPEPQSPLASGLHWADGLAAAPQQQQQQQGPASQASPFLGGGSQVQVQVLPALEADLPSAFKPMDLEQVSSLHCHGGSQPTGAWGHCCGVGSVLCTKRPPGAALQTDHHCAHVACADSQTDPLLALLPASCRTSAGPCGMLSRSPGTLAAA